ncbi:MAG: hypothetical protein MK226_05780 [Saprospiraceae bacterium]|nr:hypothetical protein [Saprospiraceae bacterium]
MKPLLVITLCLCFSISYAQDFQSLIQEGNAKYDAKEYTDAAKLYDQALEMKEGSASNYYNAACYTALAGNDKKAMQYLIKSSEKGWKDVSWMKKDSDLKSLHDKEGWEKATSIAQANLDEYEKDLDKPLMAQLEAIHVKDQTLRQLYREAEEKFGRESEEMKYFWSLVNEQDSLNELEVIKIIDERGWVGKSVVGGKANMTIWLVIQHAPLETQEKYLPMLRESVKQGESSGSHLALLEDRIQMRNGNPQTYGSQITMNPETGQQEVYEIKDPEYVNQRRKEVGLGPIQDYVKRWGIEWTVEQKEK